MPTLTGWRASCTTWIRWVCTRFSAAIRGVELGADGQYLTSPEGVLVFLRGYSAAPQAASTVIGMTSSNGELAIDIVVPVFNEERSLGDCVTTLVAYLGEAFHVPWRVTIADNASTDGTQDIGEALAEVYDGVVYRRLSTKGRGYALRDAWAASPARVLAYLDVDLSTDLSALPPLIAPLLSGHSDISIGTRLRRDSRVVRGTKREFISRTYNAMLHGALGVRFSDAQCGFKAVRADVARALLPHVEDNKWFFDTELLVLAERAGLRIHEIPVDWTDDLDSRVDIIATAVADLRGMARLGIGFARGSLEVPLLRGPGPRAGGRHSRDLPLQIARFTVIGVVSTIAYVVLFLLLRTIMSAQAANVVSLLVTAVANTAANRRLTFRISGRSGSARHQFKGLIAFGICLALTSGALAALGTGAGRLAEVSVLIAANLVASVLRFLLYRHWVFGRHRGSGQRGSGQHSSGQHGSGQHGSGQHQDPGRSEP